MDDYEHVFTFGKGQQHEDFFFVVKAESSKEARDHMFEIFGSKWSMHYTPPNARDKAGVDRFNLTELI